MFPMSIPSPSSNEIHLFTIGSWNLTVAYYGICIAIGILVAFYIVKRRYIAKGGNEDIILSIACWAVVFGIIGGRLYHVITDYQLYFGPGKDPWQALNIRGGGLGIFGAVALGGVGALIAARRNGVRLMPVGDALAPGLLCAQAIGRLGNYFNQELFGAPTTLPWGLEIDSAHLPTGYMPGTLFHPTFLYELLWCLGAALVLVLAQKPLKLYGGQLFATYVALYSLGRVWIENLRIDQAHIIAGLRLNVWTTLILLFGAVSFFLYLRKRYMEDPSVDNVYMDGCEPVAESGKDSGEELSSEFVEDSGDEANVASGSESVPSSSSLEDKDSTTTDDETNEHPGLEAATQGDTPKTLDENDASSSSKKEN